MFVCFFAALLQVIERVRGGVARAIGDESAGGPRRDGAVPGFPPGKQMIHDAGALGVGQELRPEADQAAGGDPELEADATGALVKHLDKIKEKKRSAPQPAGRKRVLTFGAPKARKA